MSPAAQTPAPAAPPPPPPGAMAAAAAVSVDAAAAEKAGVARKREIVAALAETLAVAEGVVVAQNNGLTAGEMAELRDALRESGARARVVKNTLARRALADSPFAPLAEGLSGPLIYGAGPDPAALAKAFREAAKANEKLLLRGGALKDAALDAAAVTALADLPGRAQLLAQLAATMNAPATQLVRTLNEVPARFARALAAVRDAKQAAGEAAGTPPTTPAPTAAAAAPDGE